MRTRMHDDEILSDPELARALLAGQLAHLAGRELRLVPSFGTDHDVYRLGDDLSLRLPRTAWAQQQAVLESTWLPRIGPHLPVAVPEVVALGEPAEDYPFRWSVQTWLPGADAASATLDDGALLALAADLAAVVTALRSLPTGGIDGAEPPERAPTARGGDLTLHDDAVRRCLADLGDRVDGPVLLRAWEQSLARAGTGPSPTGPSPTGPSPTGPSPTGPSPTGPSSIGPSAPGRAWCHGDLLGGNVLLTGGRVSGLIDFGALGVTDPALDLLPLWSLLPGASGAAYEATLDADPDTRLRARGWALLQAVQALPYYWRTNPGIVRQSLVVVRAITAETP